MYTNKPYLEKKYGFRTEEPEVAYMRGSGFLFRESSWITKSFKSFGENPDSSWFLRKVRDFYGSFLGGWVAIFKTGIPVFWEFMVLNDGDPVILISSQQDIDPLITKDRDFINFTIFGSDDTGKWNLFSDTLLLHIKTTILTTSPILYRYEGMFGQKAKLYTEGYATTSGETIAYFRNMQLQDRHRIIFEAIEVDLAIYQKSFDRLAKIKAGVSRYGLFSCLILNPTYFPNDLDLISYVERFGWWSSLAFGNLTFAPIIRSFDGSKNLTGITILNPIVEEYKRSNIIPQSNLAEFYAIFQNLPISSNLSEFQKLASLHANARSQKYLEMKLAALLMTYEFSVSFVLKHIYNVPVSEIEKRDNVQTKLNFLNTYMKFIKKEFLGDNLRADIRNPLFHTGDIPNLKVDDVLQTYFDYYDLLSRIILRAFGYKGKYISIHSGNESDV